MTTGRWAAVAAVLGMGVLAGCGADNKSCDSPEINQAPTSCSLAADSDVSVKIRWCNCGASVTCDVTFDSGQYFLTPTLTSCDSSCPSNPTDCGLDSTISCRFRTPAAGTYPVNIINGLGVREATFYVASSGDFSCGP
jgi:hypothetical protein